MFDTLIASRRWDRPRLLRSSELKALRCQAYLLAAQAREAHEEKRANLVTRVSKATDTVIELTKAKFESNRLRKLQSDLVRVFYLLKKPVTPLSYSLLAPAIAKAQEFLLVLPKDDEQSRFEVAHAIIRALRPGSKELQTHKAGLLALQTLDALEDSEKVALADRILALTARVTAWKTIDSFQWRDKTMALAKRFQRWQLPTWRRWQQPYFLAQALFDNSFQLYENEIYRLLVKAEKEPLAPLGTIRAGVDTMVEMTDGRFRKGLARAKRPN